MCVSILICIPSLRGLPLPQVLRAQAELPVPYRSFPFAICFARSRVSMSLLLSLFAPLFPSLCWFCKPFQVAHKFPIALDPGIRTLNINNKSQTLGRILKEGGSLLLEDI